MTLTDFTAPEVAARAVETSYSRLEAAGSTLRTDFMRETLPYSWASVSDAYVETYRRAHPALALPVW